MTHLDRGDAADLRQVLDTPSPDEDIQTAADHWLSTLEAQEERALTIIDMIETMIAQYR
jgi:hypothetical protein